MQTEAERVVYVLACIPMMMPFLSRISLRVTSARAGGAAALIAFVLGGIHGHASFLKRNLLGLAAHSGNPSPSHLFTEAFSIFWRHLPDKVEAARQRLMS